MKVLNFIFQNLIDISPTFLFSYLLYCVHETFDIRIFGFIGLSGWSLGFLGKYVMRCLDKWN